MQGRDRVCEACGGRQSQSHDWILHCPSCGFLASTLTPGAGTGVEGLEALRKHNYARLLDRLETLRPLQGARILEVGCAWGWFLAAARERGASVQGIEPERANAELARAAGLPVEVGYFPADLEASGPFDAIVFNDVFEHIPQPSALLGPLEALLAPDGLLVINLPSSAGALFRLARTLDRVGVHGPFERLWQKGFPSPHISYFNPNNLRLLVERHSGLRRALEFPLDSVLREGLSERIGSSHRGLAGTLMLAGIWTMSFVLPLLPSDIHVGVFRRS